MIITAREIRQGDKWPPFYYGYSYTMFEKMAEVWHPIPLNYGIRVWNFIKYSWNMLRGNTSWLDNRIYKAENRAYQQAFKRLQHIVEMKLEKKEVYSQGDLTLFRQWFDCVQDVHTEYLNKGDYVLAKKLYQQLGMRVPSSILEGEMK